MKVAEALIAWTPAGLDSPTAGRVQVGPLISEGQGDWTKGFSTTGGAAHTVVRKMFGIHAVAKIFVEFHALVVRDGLDPKAVHEAFLAIDEYATHIAPDVPGARDET